MKEEKKKILEMLKEGKVSVDEAERLLSALESSKEEDLPEGEQRPRTRLHIQVFEGDMEEPKVNVCLPFKLIKWGLRFIPKEHSDLSINEKQISYDELVEILDSAEIGELVEVFDNEKKTRVVIRAT